MFNSLEESRSLLAVDIGSVATRVAFFDLVEGEYRFIASGEAASTAGVPYSDIGESLQQALLSLEKQTGRILRDKNGYIAQPAGQDGWNGVDDLVVTHSAGPELRIVAAGLLQEGSRLAAQKLAFSVPGRLIERIGLNDRRKPEEKVDAILNSQANLVILAGGSENGASRAVYRLVEMVLLASRILPVEKRPRVIYAGNQALSKRIKDVLGRWVDLHIAPNISPQIDAEDLNPAREVLSGVVTAIRSDQIGGIQNLAEACSAPVLPAAHAFGNMIQFMSKVSEPGRPVMGVDLGASGLTMAAAVDGDLSLNTYPYGMGSAIRPLAEEGFTGHVLKWLPFEFSEETLRDLFWQKSLYPASLPVTEESLAIEQAAARCILQIGVSRSQERDSVRLPAAEKVIAAGAVLGRAPKTAQALMILLDGLQPAGVTSLMLDRNGITAALGAAARFNPALAVQVFGSSAFINLAAVISPLFKPARIPAILAGRLQYEDGSIHEFEVEQGSLASLPLPYGEQARIRFAPDRRITIDPYGKHRREWYPVTGGLHGVVIDARGRPLMLPVDPAERCEQLQKWSGSIG